MGGSSRDTTEAEFAGCKGPVAAERGFSGVCSEPERRCHWLTPWMREGEPQLPAR